MCYDRYDAESDSYDRKECGDFLEIARVIDSVEPCIKKIVQLLYGQREFDLILIDDLFGEVCDALKIDMPHGLPRIRARTSDDVELRVV
jgi:hypothetical protein